MCVCVCEASEQITFLFVVTFVAVGGLGQYQHYCGSGLHLVGPHHFMRCGLMHGLQTRVYTPTAHGYRSVTLDCVCMCVAQ